MNTKRYVIGSLVVFLFIFVFEFIFHGMVLHDIYAQLPNLLRPQTEANGLLHWMVFAYLLRACLFSYIFIKGYENKGIMEGVRYGLVIALAFGVSSSLIQYVVQPWPGNLILAWIVGYLVEMIIAGVILAAIYKPKTA
jgi:hypothetical protein